MKGYGVRYSETSDGGNAVSFYLPYRLIGWCAKHGWHASNVRCTQCVVEHLEGTP